MSRSPVRSRMAVRVEGDIRLDGQLDGGLDVRIARFNPRKNGVAALAGVAAAGVHEPRSQEFGAEALDVPHVTEVVSVLGECDPEKIDGVYGYVALALTPGQCSQCPRLRRGTGSPICRCRACTTGWSLRDP